jgi:hypothetical protein
MKIQMLDTVLSLKTQESGNAKKLDNVLRKVFRGIIESPICIIDERPLAIVKLRGGKDR